MAAKSDGGAAVAVSVGAAATPSPSSSSVSSAAAGPRREGSCSGLSRSGRPPSSGPFPPLPPSLAGGGGGTASPPALLLLRGHHASSSSAAALPALPGAAPAPPAPPVASLSGRGGRFGAGECAWALGALLVFFSDGASDLWLSAHYYLRGQLWWFGLTLLFVLLPSVVVQALSFRWFVYDFTASTSTAAAATPGTSFAAKEGAGAPKRGAGGSGGKAAFSTKDSAGGGGGCSQGASPAPLTPPAGPRGCCRCCLWLLQTLIHLLQLGQVWRYLRTMYLGLQSRWQSEHRRRHFYWRMMFENADISMLRLLETFLKSAPQLVLQLSIMVHQNYIEPLQGLSASASLVSLAWTLASYQKVLRDSREDKLPMSYKGAMVQILWHLFTIAARAIAFALFASVFQLYFGIFIVTHWCIMTFWIIQGETDFCMSKWEEIIYNMVVGIIYIFCWFNVKEGRSRCRMSIYYIITLSENAAMTGLWYWHRNESISESNALIIVCVVTSSFALGVFFMFIYYCLLHPNGTIFATQSTGCMCREEATAVPGGAGDVVTSPPRSLPRTTGAEREGVPGDRDSCVPVFQVRPSVPPTPVPRAPRTEGPVIRIDLPRKKYPAWDAHFIDRRLRKTILALEYSSPTTPRLQYRSVGASQELLEYETTV
ncbi:XK-related protein 7 [Anolis sagrei]|uniref:XK-related protein 7 n=1 Tax=Anolis sagrei TaxID=38937 RepID=UPI0035216F25